MPVFDYDMYKNIHCNVPGFVIGTGMSTAMVLENSGLSLADFNPAVVIGIKQSYRLLDSTYWLCMDDVYYDLDQSNIARISAPKFVFDSNETRQASMLDNKLIVLQTPNDNGTADPTNSDRFSLECKLSDSGVAGLRLAHLLGLNPIYIVGLGDKVHDGKFYFHNDSIISDIDVNAVYNRKNPKMISYVTQLQDSGTEVFSCSPISSLNESVAYIALADVLKEVKSKRA